MPVLDLFLLTINKYKEQSPHWALPKLNRYPVERYRSDYFLEPPSLMGKAPE
jgi:hypothetical protein